MIVSIGGSVGDWVTPPPGVSTKISADRKRVIPAPRMLIATPDTMWSTPKVTVASACSSPPRAPPTMPARTPHQAPNSNAPQAPNQVPRMSWPSRPMLTTPARSDHRPPRPASPMGTASRSAAPVVPLEVMSSAPVTSRTIETSASSPAMLSRTTGSVIRGRRRPGACGTISWSMRPVLMPGSPRRCGRRPRLGARHRPGAAAGPARSGGPARTRSRPRAPRRPA